jgi:hypothetical protein
MDVIEYFTKKGVPHEIRGGHLYIKSLFKKESTPSMCIYPTLTYYDWSTNKHGTISDIMCLLGDEPIAVKYNLKPKKQKEFSLYDYIETKTHNISLIKSYANSRGIYGGYIPSGFMWRNQYHLGMMFVHLDVNLKPCGFKIRAIDDKFKQRFYAKGKLNAYVLNNRTECIISNVNNWLVESETSASTLYQYLDGEKLVISFGSVASIGKIPTPFQHLKFNLLIDYDGDEYLYQERLQPYLSLNVNPIKLILPKGEDINSLYVKGELYKYL